MANDDFNIKVDDKHILFNKTKNNRALTLAQGAAPEIGDTIGIHPYGDTKNQIQKVTHGLNYFQVGDEVIIRKLSGDSGEAAFRPDVDRFKDCNRIGNTMHDQSVYWPDTDDCYYRKYIFNLDTPIVGDDGSWPSVNLRIDLDIEYSAEGFQAWYPLGGMWLGVSDEIWTEGNDDTLTWFWCVGTGDPYLTIAGPPMFYPEDTGLAHFCVENWLQGCPLCCPPPFDEIHSLQVHMHTNSSLYWGGVIRSRLIRLIMCEGTVEPGWCDTSSIRDYL